MNTKLRIALIANTGMGNEVLKALLNCSNVVIDSLCARRLEGSFPYFEEEEIEDFAIRNGINCFINVKANHQYYEYLKTRDVDIIIVASFHQILKSEIIKLPKFGFVNLHPSLLPLYRGPSPLNWVILNDETKTGVTAHYLIEKIDAGNVLLQNEIDITRNETIGSIFKKVSITAGQMVYELIDLFAQTNCIPEGIPQNEVLATYLKKPDEVLREISYDFSFEKAFQTIRAFHPYPGSMIKINSEEHRIKDYSLSDPGSSDYRKFSFSNKEIFLLTEKIK